MMDRHETLPAAGGEPILFASFRLDPRAGQLTQGGRPIPLRPKTWAVLLHLARRPGTLVTKEELLDAVWPNVAVTPDTLTKSIGELRLALGDDSQKPRCIETVHRRGFRFIAQIQGSGFGADAPENGDSHTGTDCFVGRAAEQRKLDALFARACWGERQMVFVAGPAGIGKTKLVEAFLQSLAVRQGVLPVWIGHGCCIEQHGTREPFMCVLDALDRLARRPEAERLLALLRRTAPTWLVQMPWLIDDAESLRQSLRAARSERMLREFSAFTERLTSDVTLVLVFEDLHWSDDSTVELLSLLAQRREPARLLVIGTYRPAEAAVHEHALSEAVRRLQIRGQCIELPLHEFAVEDVERYLELRFPGSEFASRLAPALHRHTDGNPLFVRAVTDHLLSRGWILETAPGWALSNSLGKVRLGVPEDIRRMIETQLQALAPLDRELLEAASVGGGEFVPQAIAVALALDVDETELRCEQLARAHRFLQGAGSAEWPDGSIRRRYGFTHELYRQTVYGAIPDGQRRRLHQRMGEAYEEAYGDRAIEIPALLAAHFERSRDHQRAVRYLAAAAAQARRRFASREGIGYLETALALMSRLPDSVERRRRELDLRLALAPVLSDVHGFAAEPVRLNCERAYDLCKEVGSREQLFLVSYGLCHIYAARADQTLAPEMNARLDELARRLGTSEHRLLADSILVRTAMHEARFTEARRLAEESVLRQTRPLPFSYGADPVIAARGHYALALWFLGYTEEAGANMPAALEAAKGSGDPFTLTAALGQSCILAVLRRDPAEARRLVEQFVSVSAEQGFAYWHAMALALKGWVRVQEGAAHEGINELQRALADFRATGARLFSTYILAYMAEAHLARSEWDAGLAAANEGLALAESTADRSYWPELWRLKGELLLASSPSPPTNERRRSGPQPARTPATHWEEGERCLLQAVELAREFQAKSLELRAATSLARAWHASERTADATALLEGVCSWFGSAETVDLVEARKLQEKLRHGSETSGKGRSGPAIATRRKNLASSGTSRA